MATATPTDAALDQVRAWLLDGPDPQPLFGEVLRRAFDEVLDGQRTGRYRIEDLSKTEKTYIGTKVEILLADALAIERGAKLDFLIAGNEVDCKFSLAPFGAMIPIEAQGEICLLVSGHDSTARFSAGLLRCVPELLRAPNRDGKRGVLAKARSRISWLFEDAQIPENLLRNLPSESLEAILSNTQSGQARVDELFRLVHCRIIRREVTVTVARQQDGMKRVRDARKHLVAEGIVILGHQDDHPRIAAALGLPVPDKGEFVATRVVPAMTGSATPAAAIGHVAWREANTDDPIVPGPAQY